ncbi:MAG: sel1 repeat family protein [Alphaproteobacteria bacterium]|nr:sel1 repeat family protein [Alphaproteobacteria bacterium]
MRLAPLLRLSSALSVAALTLGGLAQPAVAGIEDGLKALQASDMPGAEKALQPLAKERDPRAQFLLGFYVYGNPDSKLYDMNKAVPLLLDSAERGFTTAIPPLAAAYADGKGVPKSLSEAYKWIVICQRWHGPDVEAMMAQIGKELPADEVEKAKAAGAAYTFKTK